LVGHFGGQLRFRGHFCRAFWQGILEGSLGFGATFVGHFGRAFGGQLI